MAPSDLEPDASLTESELVRASLLRPEQLAAVDRAILSFATDRPRKAAFVIASAMASCRDIGMPDVFFVQRLQILVEAGQLQAFGDLAYMRYSEVCLPGSFQAAKV